MRLGQKILVIGISLFLGMALCLPKGRVIFAQNETSGVSGTSAMPMELLRPQYGEDPRFPKDYVIGELGRGDATVETYKLAREIVASLAAGNGKVDQVVFPEQKRLAALNRLNAIGVRSWRVGGGRSEGDGGYSFLVRFLGRERSITGELYLQWQTPIVINEVEAEPVETSMTTPTETATEEGTATEPETTAPGTTTTEGPTAAENTATETRTATTELRTTAEETENTESGDTAEAAIAETEETPEETETAEEKATTQSVVEPGVETVIKEEPRLEDKPHWRVDDLLLEPPRGLADGRFGPGGADMTPYERFF